MNILTNLYNFNKELTGILKDKSIETVCIVPLSHAEVYYKHQDLFNALYDYNYGKDFNIIAHEFSKIGVLKYNITTLNPFTMDSKDMIESINKSDCVFLTGGNPVTAMCRIEEYNLYETLNKYDGVVIGASAGAMILQDEFYLHPGTFMNGLNRVKNINLIVHDTDEPSSKLADAKKFLESNRNQNEKVYLKGNNFKIYV